MVSDTILEFAKAFFENFNNSVEIQLKNQNEIVTATIDGTTYSNKIPIKQILLKLVKCN